MVYNLAVDAVILDRHSRLGFSCILLARHPQISDNEARKGSYVRRIASIHPLHLRYREIEARTYNIGL